MKLSLAMIAKNETAVLGHCLESVQGLVDEIILVDTGSTDETQDLARQQGAQLYHFPWSDDFSAARNESLKHCTGDWILILDADEAIDSLDHAVIRQACLQEEVRAFRLVLRNYFSHGGLTTLDEPAQPNHSQYSEGSKYSHFADARGLRLCRNFPGLAFTGRIHELLDPYFEARSISIENLQAVVHHFGKAMPEREAAKKPYYLELAQRDVQKNPSNHQYQFNLVQQGMMAENWPVVLKAAKAYMRLQRKVPPLILFAAALALQCQDRHQEALSYFGRLLEALPTHAPALTRVGISMAVLNRIDEARTFFHRALEAQPGFLLPLVNLAEMESTQGRQREARELLLSGLETYPSDSKLLACLVKTDLQMNDVDTAVRDAWMAIQRCPQGGEGLWHRLVALSLQKQGHVTQANQVLGMGLQAFPQEPELLRIQSVLKGL